MRWHQFRLFSIFDAVAKDVGDSAGFARPALAGGAVGVAAVLTKRAEMVVCPYGMEPRLFDR